jgi:type IV pilus biogenesis protein CpaD/CtpE
MRKIVPLALLLAGCATTPPATNGAVPGQSCTAAGIDHFIGQQGSSETGAAIMRATHSAVLRWAPPGYMLTMDFRADRVTVRLGPDGKVTAIDCG